MTQDFGPLYASDVTHRSLGHEVYTELVYEIGPPLLIEFFRRAEVTRGPQRAASVVIPTNDKVFGLSLGNEGALQVTYEGGGMTDSFVIPVTEARQIADRALLEEQINRYPASN